jgi:hypothetical protein
MGSKEFDKAMDDSIEIEEKIERLLKKYAKALAKMGPIKGYNQFFIDNYRFKLAFFPWKNKGKDETIKVIGPSKK